MTQIRERMGFTLLVAYVSTFMCQVANQAFFFLILRLLPLDSVGLYSWAIAVATIYTYVLDLGLPIFLVGELTKARYGLSEVLQLIFWLRMPVLLIGFIAFEIWVQVSHPSPSEYWTLLAIGLTYMIQLIDIGLVPWFQVHQRQNLINTLAMIVPLGRLLVLCCALWGGLATRLTFIVAMTLATQLAATGLLVYLAVHESRKALHLVKPNENSVRELLRGFWRRGPRLALMYSLNILQARLDWLLVAALVSRIALANYSLANKVAELTMLLAGVWARTSFPWLSRADAQEPAMRAHLALLQRLFVVGCGIFGVVLFFWSPWLVRRAFENKYADAETSIRLMTLVTVVLMLNQYFFYVVLSQNLEKKYTVLIVLSTLLQIGIDIALLPRLGIVGAAWGMLVMGIVMHSGQIVLLKRSGTFTGYEIFRMELFVSGSIAVMTLLWFLRAGEIVGTVSGIVLVAALGGLVLDSADRMRLGDWWTRRRSLLTW